MPLCPAVAQVLIICSRDLLLNLRIWHTETYSWVQFTKPNRTQPNPSPYSYNSLNHITQKYTKSHYTLYNDNQLTVKINNWSRPASPANKLCCLYFCRSKPWTCDSQSIAAIAHRRKISLRLRCTGRYIWKNTSGNLLLRLNPTQ